jgi:hypothetical protein
MRRAALSLLAGLIALVPSWPSSGAGEGPFIKAINAEKINTEMDEDDPFVTTDNMSLYYASNAQGTFDILVSHKNSLKDTWPAGKPFLDSKDADERSPFLHKSGFYFASNEVPDPMLAKEKNFDLFKKLGMQAPFPVLAVSERADEMHPWITPAGKEFYFSRKTDDGWVLFIADGPSPGPIGNARPVGFPPGFHHGTLSNSTLQMYLQGPLENGRSGLFHSRRAKVGAPWSKPELVIGLNHPGGKRGDMSPCLTADGARLYFASDRPDGKGGLDIWYVFTNQLK